MRFQLTLFFWGAVMTGGAHASSFVVLEPMKEPAGPSMITLGEESPSVAVLDNTARDSDVAIDPSTQTALAYPVPTYSVSGGDSEETAPDAEPRQISPSIIAFGAPAPDVSYETFAAIDPEPSSIRKTLGSTPMVIRGGIVGDPFNRAGAAPASASPTRAAAQAPAGGSPDKPIPKPEPKPEPKAPKPPEPRPNLLRPE